MQAGYPIRIHGTLQPRLQHSYETLTQFRLPLIRLPIPTVSRTLFLIKHDPAEPHTTRLTQSRTQYTIDPFLPQPTSFCYVFACVFDLVLTSTPVDAYEVLLTFTDGKSTIKTTLH